MIRILFSAVIGVTATLVLFWLMQYMIFNNQQGIYSGEDLQMVEFIRLKRETKLQTKDRKVPEKPLPKKRPIPPKMQDQQASVVKNELPEIDMPNLDIPLQKGRFSGPLLSGVRMGKGKISSNVFPLLRVPPRYPMRAARRKIEGWVKIELTITELGAVKDAVVVESEPDDVFDQAALQAIAKWKFKPKIIDGEAFEQRALQILQFKLTK